MRFLKCTFTLFKGKCHFNTEKIQFKVQTTCVVCGWVCERASASNFNGKNTFFCSHYIYYKIMVKFTSNVNFSFKAFHKYAHKVFFYRIPMSPPTLIQ